MTNRPRFAGALFLALTALSGCSSLSDLETSSDRTNPATETPTGSATAAPLPAITFDVEGGDRACVGTAGESRSVAVLFTAIKANTDLVINDVAIENSPGVTLVTQDSINLPPVNPGGAIGYRAVADWPLTKEEASNNVRWATRDGLIGRTYAAGETGLPVLHLIGKPGASVGTVVYRYTSDTEPDGEARYDLNLIFAKRC